MSEPTKNIIDRAGNYTQGWRDCREATPGPWEVGRSLCGHYASVLKRFRTDHNTAIAGIIQGYMYADDPKAQEAVNAELIVSAVNGQAAMLRYFRHETMMNDPRPGASLLERGNKHQRLLKIAAALGIDATAAEAEESE